MKSIKLKRVKYLGDKPNAPDYSAFYENEKGYFKIVGFVDDNTSDLSLLFKKIEIKDLNKWELIEFNKWMISKRKKK